jgi:hypothetical protein
VVVELELVVLAVQVAQAAVVQVVMLAQAAAMAQIILGQAEAVPDHKLADQLQKAVTAVQELLLLDTQQHKEK